MPPAGHGHLGACHCCGLIHRVPDVRSRQVAVCLRRDSVIRRPGKARKIASRSAAATVGALVLFWPTILLPILEIEGLGHTHESSILAATVELLAHGSWFVGGVVLLFSIVFALARLLLLLELSLLGIFGRRHRALTYCIMEHAG